METLQVGDLENMAFLACGGFGTVYKGRSRKLGRDVAIKFLHDRSRKLTGASGGSKQLLPGDQGLEHKGETQSATGKFKDLMTEKEMMLKASDTYVLRVLATCERPCNNHVEYGLVMEYMHHGTLHLLFDTFDKKEDFVPWALRFQILHQVALAMTFLHSLTPPIIHRDLKPQNVLLDQFLNVRLTDFGLAILETSVSSIKAGTLSYMAPEAIESGGYKPTKEYDVYSFGILTWSVLSGRHPYPAKITEIIENCVRNKNRPPMKYLDSCKNVKMVDQAIGMMEKCWDDEPNKRPSFVECVNSLEKMKEEYAGEILDAVFGVLKKLETYSQIVEVSDMPDGGCTLNTSRIEEFINDLREDTTTTGVTVETIVFEDAKRFLQRNFDAIIQREPEWSFILDGLYTQGIFTDEQVASVKSSPIVPEQIRNTLRMIMKQGKESCRTLLQLLNRHHPSLMRALAVPAKGGPFYQH